jgi:hypothetical protein
MIRAKQAMLCVLALPLFIFGCQSVETVKPGDRQVDVPELGGKVNIISLEYDFTRFPVDKIGYYEPKDGEQLLAVFTIQAERIDRKVLYDFYNITLNIGDRKVHPQIVRYFRGDENADPQGGYQATKKEMTVVKFKESGSYKILLAYLQGEEDVFESVTFFDGRTVPFNIVRAKEDTTE